MPLFSELVTKLKLDDTQFKRDLQGSKKGIANFAASMGKLGGIATAVIGGTVVAAFASVVSVVNQTTEEIDELAKRAHKFGSSIASMQKLQYAAALSGVSVQTLNSGMSRLVQTLYKADNPASDAAAAFKELGLSVKELGDLSIDQQYIKISDAINKIPNANKQAELSVRLFGKSGVEQLNLLRANLSDVSTEFDTFGAALTDEQAAAVETYSDSLDRMSAIFGAFKIQLTATLAGPFTAFVGFISDSIVKMGGLGEAGKQAGLFIANMMIAGVAGFQSFLNFVDSAIQKLKQLQLFILQTAQSFDNFKFAVGGGDLNLDRMDEIARLQKQISKYNPNAPGITAGLSKSLESAKSQITNAGSNTSAKSDVNLNVSFDKALLIEVAKSDYAKVQMRKVQAEQISNAAKSTPL